MRLRPQVGEASHNLREWKIWRSDAIESYDQGMYRLELHFWYTLVSSVTEVGQPSGHIYRAQAWDGTGQDRTEYGFSGGDGLWWFVLWRNRWVSPLNDTDIILLLGPFGSISFDCHLFHVEEIHQRVGYITRSNILCRPVGDQDFMRTFVIFRRWRSRGRIGCATPFTFVAIIPACSIVSRCLTKISPRLVILKH